MLRRPFVAALVALVLAAPASGAGQAGAPALPTGDDGAFRARMLAWDAPPPARDDDPGLATIATAPLVLGPPLRRLPAISSRFGMRADPLGLGWRLHPGIDLPGLAGSPVLAAGSGTVAYAGWRGGYGNLVEIDHGGGLRTRYGHLMRVLVAPGAPVARGEVIGLMGSTGHSTGTHLHYEVRELGRAVNPLGFAYAARGATATIAVPYLPPLVSVAPRWRDWAGAAAAGQLPAPGAP